MVVFPEPATGMKQSCSDHVVIVLVGRMTVCFCLRVPVEPKGLVEAMNRLMLGARRLD